jgi:hypothetical protein
MNLGTRNFPAKSVEKIKTHILCSMPFFSENRAANEVTLQLRQSWTGHK